MSRLLFLVALVALSSCASRQLPPPKPAPVMPFDAGPLPSLPPEVGR